MEGSAALRAARFVLDGLLPIMDSPELKILRHAALVEAMAFVHALIEQCGGLLAGLSPG